MDTAQLYQRFATKEARGYSPAYENLGEGVAGDAELIGLLDRLPVAKRQPYLLLAAIRYLDGPIVDYGHFRDWVLGHWRQVLDVMMQRRIQTNEPTRCATLLPVLAALPQPLALVEVGASAGLCLYPDRYRYIYDCLPGVGPEDSPVTLVCSTTGAVPLPQLVPTVVWRAGIDLNPLNPADADDVRWLESLVWPEQPDRLRRLRGALRVAQAEPAHIIRGDLNDVLADLAAQAPADATLVVFHSAVLLYLSQEARMLFAEIVRALPGHWISNETANVLPAVRQRLPRPVPDDRTVFVLSLDGQPMAFTGPHGQTIEWFD